MTHPSDETFLDEMVQMTTLWELTWPKFDRLVALARRAPALTWQPMETAPKDGTLIWLYMADQNVRGIGHWLQRTDGGIWVWSHVVDTPAKFDGTTRASHWMPLPAPPEARP